MNHRPKPTGSMPGAWLGGAFLALLLVAGAMGMVVLHRPRVASPAAIAPAAPAAPPVDGGLSDDEVFAASMARLAEARLHADDELAAARASADTGRQAAGPALDAGALGTARNPRTAPSNPHRLERVADRLRDDDLAGAVEEIHALYRERSPAAAQALTLLARALQDRARAGSLSKVEPVLPRVQELPTSEPSVRTAVARVLASVALASAKAGQSERSRQQARAALALDESPPEAYLALGEYQFQNNDLAGALDTWEHGLRLNPGDGPLTRRLERGRAEAERLGSLDRVTSEHFVVSFDGRADVPGARACLEIMEAAYRSVGALFQLYPDGPIPVVLYPDRTYEQEGHVPWSAAVYTGKIRLPSAGASTASPRFRGTLFHEYAHALFQRATSGLGGPAWLNEGFADIAKLQADPGPSLRCTPDVHYFPLKTLEAGFGRIGNHKQVHLGYLEARHAVEHILERHGQEGIRSLLAALSTGAPFPVAFERALGEDYSTFASAFDAEGPH
jgi:tetratricopeptide (TPR) repeat protein